MRFRDLENLRRFLTEIRSSQVKSLANYFDASSYGFAHKLGEKKLSIASNATCVLSLLESNQWDKKPWSELATEMVEEILLRKEWKSGDLDPGNVFSTAFVLECVSALEHLANAPISQTCQIKINEAEEILKNSLTGSEKGAARLKDYPSSAYLTQLVVRVLKNRNKIDPYKEDARSWAKGEITRQLTLSLSGAKSADVYSLAYSTIILASLSSPSEVTPDDARIQRTAIEQIFAASKDGSWPLGRPLFHYPKIGSAYCYEYEMLVQLLLQPNLRSLLLDKLSELSKSAYALRYTSFQLANRALGWASGHHPQLPGPESWSTASVFHFAYVLDRLLAEAIRRELFAALDQPYPETIEEQAEFAPGFLDSEIPIDGKEQSLKDTLYDRFVAPIKKCSRLVARGQSLPEDVSMSAIFFGPPGTSKTKLAKLIAEFLGWPLLVVDPSHLVKRGMDRVQAEANTLFSMLVAAERIVVLFDEFDEMMRDRALANTEAVSRFLTTAMLPKLTSINDNRRIVFILATNYIDQFDFAISRPGRFDTVLQVMPPALDAKLTRWPEVKEKLDALSLSIDQHPKIREHLTPLTYKEFETISKRLQGAADQEQALSIIETAFNSCILQRKIPDSQSPQQNATSWQKRCEEQVHYIR